MKKPVFASLIAATILSLSLAQTAFPISIKHDASETTISSQPKRIIALHPTSLEILLALGVQPVGIGGYGLMGAQPVGQAASTVPSFDDLLPIKPQHVGIENPSLEAMLALKPDLILSITFAAQNVYPQFSKIAPTLVYNYSGERSWEKGFFDVAKLLGRQQRARKVVSQLEAQARTNRNRLAPAIASGNKLAVFALRGSQLLSTGLGFAPSRLLNQLGFKNVAATNAPVFAPMSSEGLLMVKADRAMLLNFGAPQETLETTVALLKRGNFKSVHSTDVLTASRSGLGPLSDAQLLDVYTKALLK